MTNERRRAAPAIAYILVIESLDACARKVDDLYSARQPYFSAGACQTNIELRILVVTRAFIVAPDRQKAWEVEECMMAVIYELRFAGPPMRRATGAE